MRPIYICLASDNNYIQLATIAITSVFEKNKDAVEIEIYILDGGINKKSTDIINSLAKQYNRKIIFIDITDKLKILKNMNVNSQGKFGSYAAYSRFFIADELPEYVDKILYIDCDTCITDSLNELFNINMSGYALGGILDILPEFHKRYLGFNIRDNYYNSGVLLFNCQEWIKGKYLQKILNHIQNINSIYSFHDQDLINIVCKGKIMTLEPKYMVFYPEYTWGEKKIRWLNDFTAEYYSEIKLKEACEKPVIIHYVDSILGRPWYEDNINSYSKYWDEMKAISPYAETFNKINRHNSIRHKILRIIYKYISLNVFCIIHKYRRNSLLIEREKKAIAAGGRNEG